MATATHRKPSIVGISFDGLPASGIVNEILNAADVLRGHGLQVLIDLGYDITLNRPLGKYDHLFPEWAVLFRSLGETLPASYCSEALEEARCRVIGGLPVTASPAHNKLCQDLAELLAATFSRERTQLLLVENGTLPDNPLFTEALYQAVEEYGRLNSLGKYVLWRDFDLMWSAEPHLYGSYPYPGVRKPAPNRFIHYAVATNWMKRRMQAWAPGVQYSVIPNRFFIPALQDHKSASFRSAYSIPTNAFLIARCTRVIPQKCIERDLRLFSQVQRRLAAVGDHRKVVLFISGPTREDSQEFQRLCSLASTLDIAGQVIWGDGLLPLNPRIGRAEAGPGLFSIGDLLAESNLSSFLTSYDYEGFGNPPGEAMAMGVPFISTTYELYHEVYGSRGAIAPLLPIDRTSSPSEPIPEYFVDWTMRVLTDASYRSNIIHNNLEVCKIHFSMTALRLQLEQLFNLGQ